MSKIFFPIIISLIFLLISPNFSIAYEKEIRSISSTLGENITKAGKRMIAVVDFTDLQGNVTELGRFLAEEFSVAFAGAGRGFEVVDRTHLKTLLAEHKLSASGIIDPQTARKLGQVAGVDALITGSITPFGDSIRLSVKILDTATAKMIGASSGDIAKTKAIEELLARGIETPVAPRQETSAPSVSYVTRSPKSKKVGEMIIDIKRIMVSKGELMVALDFFNQSDKQLKIAIPWDVARKTEPKLMDDKGNIFKYDRGIPTHRFYYRELRDGEWLTINSKTSNDVVIYFRPKESNINIKEIGSNFALSLQYTLLDPKEKEALDYSVSFIDVVAQKAK